jgi:hypothetical protein
MVMAVSAAAAVGGTVMSSSASRSASRDARNASRDELNFARERYDDWKEVFGPIQENLAEFYNNLDGDFIAAQGLDYYEQERTKALTALREDLAQRGISNSGIAANVESKMAQQSIVDKARIRAEAPMQAAKLKTDFLQIGLGQNPANSMQNVLSNNAMMAQNRANQAAVNAGESAGAAVDSLLNYYEFTQNKPQPTPQPTQPVTNTYVT